MLENDYSEGQANRGMANKVAQEAIKQNIAEFISQGVKAEDIIRELDEIKELSLKKKDYATAKECVIWKGKHIAMFTDKQIQIKDITEQERQERIDRLKIYFATDGSIQAQNSRSTTITPPENAQPGGN